MNAVHFKSVIVGAGAMGCAAAYQLARRGEPVLLLEQFAFGHDRGSSHSQARITRHSYADERYARLMVPAFRAWRELEADAGVTLYYRTGGVSFCPPEADYVDQVAASLDAAGIAHRRMSGEEWNWRHRPFAVPPNFPVVFEPDAGILAASRALGVFLNRAGHYGAVLRPETPVRRIDLDAETPTVLTDTERITADRLIVAAGSWVKKLLPGLAVTLNSTLQQVLYFQPENRVAADYALGSMPVFIYKGNTGEWDAFYGMPPFGGLGVKVARHGGPPADPDAPVSAVDPAYRAVVRDWLRQFLPGLADAPISREETCLYTIAPGENFLVGPLPGRPDVLLASPCSGHGFKFSCLIGQVLADLATAGSTDLDISPWSIPQG